MNANYTTVLFKSQGPPPIPDHLETAPSLLPFISDEWLTVISPVVTYWVWSMVFHYMDVNNIMERYRLHTPEELTRRNPVSKREVFRDVILQQVVQVIVGYLLGAMEPPEMTGMEELEIWNISRRVGWTFQALLTIVGIDSFRLSNKLALFLQTSGGSLGQTLLQTDVQWKLSQAIYWIVLPLARTLIAVFFLDAWQYFVHRLFHSVPYLYRTLHSHHHRLYVPYAYGALYNHPIEGLVMDTVGAGLAFKLSGMTLKGAIFFFNFCTMKTVDDHCGYKLPFDPLQLFFWNNAEYHDIHHQGWGIKNNFSQPFFICWDRWLGTQYMGNDHHQRNQKTRDRIAKQIEKEQQQKTVPIPVRERVREEDDPEYLAATNTSSSNSAEVNIQKRKVRTSRKGSILDGSLMPDATVKEVADSIRESGQWVNEVVGNISGAKMR